MNTNEIIECARKHMRDADLFGSFHNEPARNRQINKVYTIRRMANDMLRTGLITERQYNKLCDNLYDLVDESKYPFLFNYALIN